MRFPVKTKVGPVHRGDVVSGVTRGGRPLSGAVVAIDRWGERFTLQVREPSPNDSGQEVLDVSCVREVTRRGNPGGRPRKYATPADKAAAFRERWAVRTFRMDPETARTVARLAEFSDVSESVVLHSLITFALLNRSWFTVGLFGKLLGGDSIVQGKRRTSKLTQPGEASDDV